MTDRLSPLWLRARDRTALVDPLLLAARVLLVVLLVGVILTIAFTVLGLVVHVATHLDAFGMRLDAPAWRPVGAMLFALIALGLIGKIALALLAMIGAVAHGDAFAPANVNRIEGIAWRILALLATGFLAKQLGTPIRGDINGFDLALDVNGTTIAFALLLFVLARVFKRGAEMREELEGTV